MLLMRIDAIVQNHKDFAIPGATSDNALQSSLITHFASTLYNAHNVKAVNDKLTNIKYLDSMPFAIQMRLHIAAMIAKIPKSAHIVLPLRRAFINYIISELAFISFSKLKKFVIGAFFIQHAFFTDFYYTGRYRLYKLMVVRSKENSSLEISHAVIYRRDRF